MNQFSIIEIAKLTAIVTGGGFKRVATKDMALEAFKKALEEKGAKLPDNWAEGKSFAEASKALPELIGAKQNGKQKDAKAPAAPQKGKKDAKAPAAPQKGKKDAKAPGGKKVNNPAGRQGMRGDKLIIPASVKENPFPRAGQSRTTFEMIMKAPGKTFREYLNSGARANTIAYAIRNGWLKVEKVKPAVAGK